MNDKLVSVFGGSVSVKSENVAAALAESATKGARSGEDGALYLNFSGKLGRYSLGSEAEEVDPEDCWLVNIYSFQDGWICWKGGRPIERRFSPVIEGVPVPAPDPEEHGPFDRGRGEGWFRAKSMLIKHMTEGVIAIYSTNTVSAVSVIANLQKNIANNIHNGVSSWPIIHLDMEKFTAQGQTNFKPKFEIEAWLSDEQVADLAGVDALSEEELDELLENSEFETDVEPVKKVTKSSVAKKKTSTRR